MYKKTLFQGVQYTLKTINRNTANDYLVKYHYCHSKTVSMLNIGVFWEDNLIGVISYGQSPTPNMHTSLVDYIQRNEYFELLRLHVKDITPKNFESWLIAESFRWIKELYPQVKILVSFADPAANHVGTIYQATNWKYSGKTSKSTYYWDPVLEKTCHPRSVSKWKKANCIERINRLVKIEKPAKYRYVYFLKKTSVFYKDIIENKLFHESELNFYLDLERKTGNRIIERHNQHLKKHIKYLENDFKREILQYPKID